MNAHAPAPTAAGPDLVREAGRIASAYVGHHHLPPADIPVLLDTVYGGLRALTAPPAAPRPERPTPAQVRASVSPDAIVSFEDGRSYKALRRHLTRLGLTPEAYKAKWGLPVDYPMVAPSYSARRSEISRAVGLGTRRPAGAP